MQPRQPSRTERGVKPLLASDPRDAAMLTIPGEFLRIHRLGRPPHDEWVAALSDGTEVIVADVDGKPSPIGMEKAIAIVQSRAYLEARARQLLALLGQEDGEWRLIAIDFGVEAQHHDCEFLMCFAFKGTKADFAGTSIYAEVGFALPMRLSVSPSFNPMFIVTIQTTTGLDG